MTWNHQCVQNFVKPCLKLCDTCRTRVLVKTILQSKLVEVHYRLSVSISSFSVESIVLVVAIRRMGNNGLK